MKIKKIVALTAACAMLSSTAGCQIITIDGEGTAEVGENGVVGNGAIGLSVSTLNNPFFVSLAEGAQAEAEEKGAVAFIAAAGMAAHLAGALAAATTKPIIGVPMKGGAMDGMDAMLSTVQMPAGMPVATVALGKAGAINAAYLAMQILAISDKDLAIKLKEDRIVKAKAVETDSKDIEVIL